jgi:hypothetical protein
VKRLTRLILPVLLALAAGAAHAGQAVRVDVAGWNDSDAASVATFGVSWLPEYTDLDHYAGIKLERADFSPHGGRSIQHSKRVYGLFAGGEAWKWRAAVGSDSHTLLGSANLYSDANGRHREIFVQREIVETPIGLARHFYYTYAGATADQPLGTRDTLVGLAGVQDFDGGNDRLHLRARYIHVLSEDWGLSAQLRTRWFRDSDPRQYDYYSPRWYGEALGVLALRRWRGGWQYSAAVGLGRQRDDSRSWHDARLLEFGLTSPRRGAWYLEAHATLTDTATGAGGGANYLYRYLEVSLNRAW